MKDKNINEKKLYYIYKNGMPKKSKTKNRLSS